MYNINLCNIPITASKIDSQSNIFTLVQVFQSSDLCISETFWIAKLKICFYRLLELDKPVNFKFGDRQIVTLDELLS